MTTSDWLKRAQQTFNKFIRERDKGKFCISCGQYINGVKHASHYYSAGGHSNVRFNENNVHVSCYKCNVQLSGNLLNYQIAIRDKIGGEELMKLHELAHIEKKWSIDELKEIIKIYKEKTTLLEKNR
jgi:hypothetical protein